MQVVYATLPLLILILNTQFVPTATHIIEKKEAKNR